MQTKPQTFALPKRRRGLASPSRVSSDTDPNVSPAGAAPEAEASADDVGRFVLWFREHYDPEFRVLLGAQTVADEALRRLSAPSMADARWDALGLGDVLLWVQDRSVPCLRADELRLVGFALANFLYARGHIGAGRRARLVRRVRFASLTGG